MIAAAYVALTYLASIFGLDKGVIQFRISEALCIMPAFFPEATLALTIGCFLANFLTGALLPDVIFGSLATLIGALGAMALRKVPKKLAFLLTVPTILANALIVPLILIKVYEIPGTYIYFMLTVGIGELVCAGVLGTLLYYSLKKAKFR